ncbi:MAG: T9SS type A sorting domain-containing protein, partial [Sphingobacteriaceae bacterium]|nr:T9SS type A sorting domain-containing protein [Cytophagaceae bacterium]
LGISGNTFTPSAAGTGSHTILYQFTDGNGCSATASRNTTVTDQVTVVGDPTVGGAPVCAGQTITLTFNVLNAANSTFTAQLSNASGDFTTPLISWTVSPGTTTLTIPGGTPSGIGYQIRVQSSAPVVTSNPSNVFRVNGLTFSSTPTVSQVPGCAGATFRVSFTLNANCGYLPGNVFRVELSDASGSFASATSLGTVSPGINTVTVPTSVPAGTGYRVRIVSSSPAQISGVSSAFTINVPGFASTPTVSLDNKCAGEAVRLSFSVNGCAFFAGNTFTAQLSNASGVFAASPVSLGLVTPGGLNNVVIPAGTPAGTGYKIRVVSANPGVTSAVSANFKVKACNTREAAPEATGLRVTVSPNPSPEGRLHIVITGAETQSVRVALFNATGQPVREQTLDRARQEETLDWDLARQPGGLYLLRVSAGREVKTLKVLR